MEILSNLTKFFIRYFLYLIFYSYAKRQPSLRSRSDIQFFIECLKGNKNCKITNIIFLRSFQFQKEKKPTLTAVANIINGERML